MPKVFTGTTFKDTYKDDWTDSAGYHKILFNSGRALQARELTQLQTILQEQVSRFAENIFLDGAAVNPRSAAAGPTKKDYVIVDEIPANFTAKDYIGQTLKGPQVAGSTDGLLFEVSHIEEETGLTGAGELSTAAILYGRYLSLNQTALNNPTVQTVLPSFSDGDTLSDVRVSLQSPPRVPNLQVRSQPQASTISSTGQGLGFYTGPVDFFTQGHFVFAPGQFIILSKFTDTASAKVGYEIQQDIVTVADDDKLYDNQGARPNLAAPGADRYRILLNLTTKAAIADPNDYLHYADVIDGVVVSIKQGDDSFNMIERRMATRHHDTHGDFIVNPFLIKYEEGDSDNALTLNVPGTTDGISPTAFVDGYRLEMKLPKILNVPKPITTTTSPIYNEVLEYGGYVDVSDANLGAFLANNDSAGFDNQAEYRFYDNSNVNIGSFKTNAIVDLDTGNDSDRYRFYIYDLRLKDGQNLRDARKIGRGNSATNLVTLTLEDNQLYQHDLGNNTSFFPIAGPRVKTIDHTVLTFVATDNTSQQSNSSGVISFNLPNASYTTADEAEWIFINKTDDTVEQVGIGAITDLGSGSVQVTGLTASKDYEIIYYFNKPAGTVTSRSKTYTEKWATFFKFTDSDGKVYWKSNDDSAGNGLPLFDGVGFVQDSATLNNVAYLADSNGSGQIDLSSLKTTRNFAASLQFDGGQRDNYYGPIILTSDGGIPKDSADVIRAKIGYFVHGASGDLFTVNSYQLVDSASATSTVPYFSYSDIPSHTSKTTGSSYNLFNVLDFRPKMDPYGSSTSIHSGGLNQTQIPKGTFHMPKWQTNMSIRTTVYNQRTDHIVLGYNPLTYRPDVRLNRGEENLDAPEPTLNNQELLLYTVRMGGNTLNAQDIAVRRHTYKGYTMADIGMLEARINRAEETIALTTSETDAKNLIELNSDGTLRSKTGFFIDDFSGGMEFTAGQYSEQWVEDFAVLGQSYDTTKYRIGPKEQKASVTLLFDENNLYDGQRGSGPTIPSKSNVTITSPDGVRGDNIYLDYREVLDSSLSQEMISWFSDGRSYEEMGYYNVNPYNVFQGEGFIKLNPASDYWIDVRRLPDRIIDGGTNVIRQIPSSMEGLTGWERFGWQGNTLPGGRDPSTLQVGQVVASSEVRRTTQRTGWWRRKSTGEVFFATFPWTRTFRITDRVTNVETITKNLGDRTVDLTSVPWMRSRKIFGRVQGLRPNTRYWPFFNKINVSQWVISRTKPQHVADLAAKNHLKTYGDVNVSLRNHPDQVLPDDQTLISDARGELYFSFWLPNNAPIPTQTSGNLMSYDEWVLWAQRQRIAARRLGGIKDPRVYDRCGWKFRAGATEFALYDVSSGNEDDCLSLARTIYVASGSLKVTQAQILTTRNVTVRRDVRRIQRQDPLAQTFMVEPGTGVPGVFITKVEVFLRKAPNATTHFPNAVNQSKIPIQLQIRGVENGTPLGDAIADTHRVYVSADSAAGVVNSIPDLENLSDVLNKPVQFKFDEPIYIQSGKEYAIVLLAECDFYEAFVAETYGLILGKTDKRVSKQPAKGSLFLSQNGLTWTPKQNQDLAYRIYTAKFKQSGVANFYNDDVDKFVHNNEFTLLADSNNPSRMIVWHPGHNLGTGDKPQLRGLDSSADYNGLPGKFLMRDRVIDSADAMSYAIKLDSAGSPAGQDQFSDFGWFGKATVETNRAYNIDRIRPDFMTLSFEGTNVAFTGSFASGVSHNQISQTADVGNDPRFNYDDTLTVLGNNQTHYFDNPKYFANDQLETDELAPQGTKTPSIVISASMKSEQESTFGGSLAASLASSGYVSDVSPVIDTQRTSAVIINNLIDNQIKTGEARSLTKNKPALFQPETHPVRGTSLSKHITKPILFESPANGARIIVVMHVPTSASVDLYYRTVRSADQDFYLQNWVLAEGSKTNSPVKDLYVNNDVDPINFQDHEYLLGGTTGDLDDFTGIQLKLVMNSTNTCEIPYIGAIKLIGLI